MFASGCNYDKLKTNLRLCMSRLKLAQKKKAELSQKSRKEIADYIAAGKPDRARIRVEHIIREDYYMEAMEMMEMYCDLLLARFGLIREMKTLDPGLAESVSSVIWVGPRINTDVPELKLVCEQLGKKYGELYVKGVREGTINTVNTKMMHRLSAEPPPRLLVESYLKEIAQAHGLTYEPQHIDDHDVPGGGGCCGELIDMNCDPNAPYYPGFRPDLMDPSQAPRPSRIATAFEPPMPEVQGPSKDEPGPTLPLSPPAVRPPYPTKHDTPMGGHVEDVPPPSYDSATMKHGGTIGGSGGAGGGIASSYFPPDVPVLPDIPDLPDVPHSDNGSPHGGGAAGGKGDVDFDELTKRFEDLKRRK